MSQQFFHNNAKMKGTCIQDCFIAVSTDLGISLIICTQIYQVYRFPLAIKCDIFEFPGEKLFPKRSHFWREALSKKTLLPLPCKECSKSFSESGSLKTHLTLIQEKSHLLVKNVLRRSHSPVPCSLFHKRKSVGPFKDCQG